MVIPPLQLILHKIMVMRKSERRVQLDAHIRCRDLNCSAAVVPCLIYHTLQELTCNAFTTLSLVREHT